MKELLLIGTAVFALTTGSVTAASQIETTSKIGAGGHTSVAMVHKAELQKNAQAEFLAEQERLEQELAKKQELEKNTALLNSAIKKLNKTVGKTWYVFSGATPSGWDCSGLTMWFYEQLGINLEHRASRQDSAGIETKSPKPGDLVVFKYFGSKNAYHVGIYIGNGNMIHAPKHGHVTRIENVYTFGGNYSKIEYRNISGF